MLRVSIILVLTKENLQLINAELSYSLMKAEHSSYYCYFKIHILYNIEKQAHCLSHLNILYQQDPTLENIVSIVSSLEYRSTSITSQNEYTTHHNYCHIQNYESHSEKTTKVEIHRK